MMDVQEQKDAVTHVCMLIRSLVKEKNLSTHFNHGAMTVLSIVFPEGYQELNKEHGIEKGAPYKVLTVFEN